MYEGSHRDTWRDETVWHNERDALVCPNFEQRDKIQRVKINIDEKSDPSDISSQLLRTNHVATFTDTGQVYFWNAGVYHPNAEAFLSEQVESAAKECGLGRLATKHFLSEVLGHVQRSTYRDRSSFDNNPRLLNLVNGLLDLETLEFRAHDSEVLSVVQLPVTYDKEAECPAFLKFLSEVAYPEDSKIIQEFFGYCLWKQYLIHKAIMVIGDGANGKSTCLNVLKALLGAENTANRSLQDIHNRRFAVADLYGKMANIYADLPDAALTQTGIFKMLTGGDTISAEYKFKNPFTFVNYAKQIYSCNRIPKVLDDDSTAFFRRWILITFPNTFQGEKENKNKLAELTTPEELSGILNWGIDGLVRLHTQNWTFTYSKSTEQIREEYIRKSDPVAAFVMDCLLQKSNATTEKGKLYQAFVEYCNTRQMPLKSQRTFFQTLPRQIACVEQRLKEGSKRLRVLSGIELRKQEDWGKDTDEEAGGNLDGYAK
jgi:putative DNA primase/helicase